MAGTKEIRTRIKSVQQTLKITSAMYLISSANLRKAKGQLDRAAPYFTKIDATIADILHRSPELEHKFFDPRTDVLEQELSEGDGVNSPLFECKNFVVTPHLGAQTYEASRDIGNFMLEKINAAFFA